MRASHSRGARDYASLAGLVGLGHDEFARLDPARRRSARLSIDRELALRAGPFAAAREADEARRARVPVASTPELPPDMLAVLHDLREVEAGRKKRIGFGQE